MRRGGCSGMAKGVVIFYRAESKQQLRDHSFPNTGTWIYSVSVERF